MRFFLFLTCCILLATSAHAACESTIDPSTPDSQLTDNSNSTITDTKTGLMWKKCLEGLHGNNCENGSADTFDWQQALQQPDAVNGGNGFAGYTDWRLPNIRELLTLLEDQCTDPAINPTRFPNTSSLQAWSGSPAAGNNLSAWYVDFKTGASSIDDRNKTFVVRLVRSGY